MTPNKHKKRLNLFSGNVSASTPNFPADNDSRKDSFEEIRKLFTLGE